MAAALLAGVGAGEAAAAPEWIDGPMTNTSGLIPDPFSPGGLRFQLITGQHAGYLGEKDASSPRVGEVFHVHGVVAVVATVSDAPIMTLVFDEKLAPDVEFAISAQNPVVCLFFPALDQPGEPDPGNCLQTPQGGPGNGYFFGGRSLAPGQGFEIRVPIRVSKPKSGIATGPAAQFGVYVSPALGSPAMASQHLFVAPAPPRSQPGPGRADTTPPAVSAVKVLVGKRAIRSLRFRLSEAARVSATLERRRGRAWRSVRRVLDRRLAAGPRTIRLGRLAAGRWRVTLVLRDAAGNVRTTRKALAVPSPRPRAAPTTVSPGPRVRRDHRVSPGRTADAGVEP